jgi:hypothetical protein
VPQIAAGHLKSISVPPQPVGRWCDEIHHEADVIADGTNVPEADDYPAKGTWGFAIHSRLSNHQA